jgi:hypothetical protein
MKSTSRTLILFIFISMTIAGCSGTIKTSRIADSAADKNAEGLRYFLPQRVEIHVYHVFLPETLPADAPMKHRIERVGDVLTTTVNNPQELWQVTYRGALFANQGVTLGLNDNGAVKTIGLQSNSGNTPVALGALQAVQTGLQTGGTFEKTREQARIDELTREANLITAQQALEKLLTGE